MPSGRRDTGRGPRERRWRKAQLPGPWRPSTGAVGRRAVVARLGGERWPAATTGGESCAFAAEGHRRRGPRADAAEGTASGAAEAAATEDGDALGRH